MLYEVPLGEDPNAVVNSGSAPFRVIETGQTNYFYGPLEVPLEVGKTYAWQVKVSDINGQETYVNNGYSEVSWFRYGKACTATEDLKATEIGPNRVNLSWKADPQAMGYKVYYKNQTAADWQTQTSFGTSLTLAGLDQKEPYSFRISTLCDVDRESPTSPEITWEAEEIDTKLQKLIDAVLHPLDQISSGTTPTASPKTDNVNTSGQPTPQAATDPLPTNIANLMPTDPTKIPCVSQVRGFENCSVTHDGVTLMGTEPLQSLAVGDPLTIYDMQAIVTEVSGGGGTYSGKALVKLPFLADMMMAVEFSNIEVKTEKPATYRGGCVTNVPASGFFRARTGLSREELKAEEVAFLDQIRKAQDPGSTYTNLSQQISQYNQTTKEIADATSAGQSLSTEQKETLLAQTISLNSQISTWLENATDLIGGSNAGETLLTQIQAILDQLAANQTAIEAGTSFPSVPNIGSTITSITDQIKALLNAPPTDTPRIQNLQATKITDKSATLTWEGDKRFTKYIVTVQKPGEGERIFVVENTKVEVENLTNASDYLYKVVGYMGEEKTDESPQQFFSTLDNVFPKPKNIVSSKLSETSIKLTWDKEALHLKYKLKYTDKEGSERFVYPTSNVVTLADLNPDMDYPFELFAIGAANQTASELGQFSTEIKCELAVKASSYSVVAGETVTITATCKGEITWSQTEGISYPTLGRKDVSILTVNPTLPTNYLAICSIIENGKIKICSSPISIDILPETCRSLSINPSKEAPYNINDELVLTPLGCIGKIMWETSGKWNSENGTGENNKLNIKITENTTYTFYCESLGKICSSKFEIAVDCFQNVWGNLSKNGWFAAQKLIIEGENFCEGKTTLITEEQNKDGLINRKTYPIVEKVFLKEVVRPDNQIEFYTICKDLNNETKCISPKIKMNTPRGCNNFKIVKTNGKDGYTSKLTVDNCDRHITWKKDGDVVAQGEELVISSLEKSVYEANCGYKNICQTFYQNVPISESVEFKIYQNTVDKNKYHAQTCIGNLIWITTPQIDNYTLTTRESSFSQLESIASDLVINNPVIVLTAYTAICNTLSGTTKRASITLNPEPSNSCLKFVDTPTEATLGQSITLKVAYCGGVVSWIKGSTIAERINLGTGLSITDIPCGTTVYQATCSLTPSCSEVITVKIKPCNITIISSLKTAEAKIGEQVTLEAKGCEGGKLVWSDGSEGNIVKVRPITLTTYTAVCTTCDGSTCKNGVTIKTKTEEPPKLEECPDFRLEITKGNSIIDNCYSNKIEITPKGCTGTLKWYDQTAFGGIAAREFDLSKPAVISAQCLLYGNTFLADVKIVGKSNLEISQTKVPGGVPVTLYITGCYDGNCDKTGNVTWKNVYNSGSGNVITQSFYKETTITVICSADGARKDFIITPLFSDETCTLKRVGNNGRTIMFANECNPDYSIHWYESIGDAYTLGNLVATNVKKLIVGNVTGETTLTNFKSYKVYCVNSQNQTTLCQTILFPESKGSSAPPVGEDKTDGSICKDYSLQNITLKAIRYTRAPGDNENFNPLTPFQLPSNWCTDKNGEYGTVKWYKDNQLIATLSDGQLSDPIGLKTGNNLFQFTCTTSEGTCEMQNKSVYVK